MMAKEMENKKRCLDLLYGASIPLDCVCYAFAYGSGAIPQRGEDPHEKMVDLILVCNDSRSFHRKNLLSNPTHYSLLFRHLHSEKGLNCLYGFQRDSFVFPKGARVFYNTMVPSRGRLIKYGVIECADFEADLLDWHWLYMAGRLQKPVLELYQWPNEDRMVTKAIGNICRAIDQNRLMALQAALLMLPQKLEMEYLLKRIVSLSYKGDVRMGWAEDSQKIEKLVAGAGDQLRQIYVPILKKDQCTHLSGDKIVQDYSEASVLHRLNMLPLSVKQKLIDSGRPNSAHFGIEEALNHLATHRSQISVQLDYILQSIVRHSSWQQSLKNAITAGFGRSLSYMWPKLWKGIGKRIGL